MLAMAAPVSSLNRPNVQFHRLPHHWYNTISQFEVCLDTIFSLIYFSSREVQ